MHRLWSRGFIIVGLVAVFGLVACSRSDTTEPPGDDPIDRSGTPGDPADPADPANPADPGKTTALSGKLVFTEGKALCDDCDKAELAINKLRELHVHSVWKGLKGKHVELRKYYSPDGALYYQKLVAFDTEAAEAKPFDPSESLPHTRVIQKPDRTGDGDAAVWDYLMVGGTWITRHHMVGKWRVEIYLDKLAGKPDIVREFTLADG